MERRKSQSSMPEIVFGDIEYAGEIYKPNDHHKKESKFYRYLALFCVLLIISVVFLTTSVAAPFRHLSFPKRIEMDTYEIDIPSNEIEIADVAPNVGDLSQPNTPRIPSKLTMITELNAKCQVLISECRTIKQTGAIMENDPNALRVIKLLQQDLRALLKMRFGEKPRILVEMVVGFPATMIDIDTTEPTGKIVFELNDIDLVPYSVYNMLEIVRRFKGGAFHRNAGHVLQAQVGLTPPVGNDLYLGQGLAFQEYHEKVPHKKLSLGYAGRPGGPAFYISTVDNSKNHGPGSQGSSTEADSCFGQIVTGEEVVNRMKHQPGGMPPSGFVSSPDNFIKILSMNLVSPHDAGAAMYGQELNSRNESL